MGWSTGCILQVTHPFFAAGRKSGRASLLLLEFLPFNPTLATMISAPACSSAAAVVTSVGSHSISRPRMSWSFHPRHNGWITEVCPRCELPPFLPQSASVPHPSPLIIGSWWGTSKVKAPTNTVWACILDICNKLHSVLERHSYCSKLCPCHSHGLNWCQQTSVGNPPGELSTTHFCPEGYWEMHPTVWLIPVHWAGLWRPFPFYCHYKPGWKEKAMLQTVSTCSGIVAHCTYSTFSIQTCKERSCFPANIDYVFVNLKNTC